MQVREALEDEWEAVGDLTVAGYDADGYLTFHDGTFDDVYAGWLRDAASRGRNRYACSVRLPPTGIVNAASTR